MTENPSQLAEYVRQLEILRQVDGELSRYLSISYVLAIGLDAAVRLGNADGGAVHLVEGEQLRVAQIIGAYPRAMLNTCVPLDWGLVGRALRRQRAEWVQDAPSDPDYRPNVAETRSQISVPLISHDRAVGILNIQTSKPDHFTPEIFEFVQLLASRLAAAIHNAQLYEQSVGQLAELKTLYERVNDLERMKTDMIRVAAHDLRNPLHNLVSALELLRDDLPAETLAAEDSLFAIMQKAIGRMQSITTDILSLERIEQPAGVDERLDLREIVRRVFEEYWEPAVQAGLALRFHDAPGEVHILGNAAQLYEAVANLVSNALKYTPTGGQVDITLSLEDGRVVVEVRDTGFGIPEDAQASLFQPFFRATSRETETIEGTGLGLHMVKRIVNRHGGVMRFSSVYGKGSLFGFELPLAGA
ncbi:MAG: GAF domain-containing sensor histidine kinase [Chloroflexi bacterium]|nr:GAF domain-containing sensor histidine kinase [Chloroflexota bacterium]